MIRVDIRHRSCAVPMANYGPIGPAIRTLPNVHPSDVNGVLVQRVTRDTQIIPGHIQTTSQVIQIKRSHDTAMIKFSIGSKYKDYITEKGYVGINGCSLTISKKNKANFYVNLIPETLKMTNLSKLRVGSLVNLELDQNTVTIVDTVKNMLAKKS